MNYIREIVAIYTAIAVLLLVPVNYVSAEPTVIYQKTVKEKITSGATLEKITKFTADGWQTINVLRIDLGNPNIKIDSLTNTDSIMKLAPLKTLAETRGAVAAINSSFFNWTGEAGGGYPDGTIIESGKVVSAQSGYNSTGDNMGSISINNANKVFFDYWKTNIKLAAPNGKLIDVAQFNKPSRTGHKDIIVLDRRWGKTSIGASEKYPEMFEVVVDEGRIAEMRFAQPAVEIPENGYVIVTTAANGPKITNNFQVGDEVKLSINTTPDWSSIAVSMTGSAILLKDGKIPSKFSINMAGKSPRTAVGSTKDGKQLIMVALDGRQNLGVGMDQTELAKLMLELGAYNAINFDGGGSTTMVARHQGDTKVSLINSPSDGAQRNIAAGLGVFSVAPPAELEGLVIDTTDTSDKNVFVNTSRSFSVKGFDRYLNPISVDPNQVTYSVSGVKGDFVGNTFYPKSSGKAVIKATVGEISSVLEIDVLGNPVEIDLNTDTIKLPLNGTKTFTVTGIDKDGFTSAINPADVKWSVNGDIGSFNGGTFTAQAQGAGYIDASVGNAHAYCGVAVAVSHSKVIDGFEQFNGTFMSSPAGLSGSYEASNEYAKTGLYSGKLTYDFSVTEGTRAAYMVLPDQGMKLEQGEKLGIWVYNTHSAPNWLRAELYDSVGSKQIIEFTKDLNWDGWKYLEASLQSVKMPARLTKIYLAQVNPVPDSGSVYFDDLTLVSSFYPSLDQVNIPADTEYKDPQQKTVAFKKTANSFRISVFGQSAEPKNILQKLVTQRFTQSISKDMSDMAVILGNGTHKLTSNIKVQTISTSKNYKSVDYKGSRLIQLDTSKNGLRKSDPGQWKWFMDKLSSYSGDNLFIFMSDSPRNFSDKLEGNLFMDMLSEYHKTKGKNVWVIYKNGSNSTIMEDGVKYFSTTGYDLAGLNSSNAASKVKYLLITVNGKDVSYEFKPSV
ncbi:MAG TPA: phosphodiester glycosidase family protein [Pseudobacteroides sp.]|uniref:phosphodiester glycosidase family protein n=1 Tax=Pseudobacteroides sp. TaxID=1968840 RepID=UPI002F925556